MADVVLAAQEAQQDMVVAGVVGEAGRRVLPARVVHGLHVLRRELTDGFAVFQLADARAQRPHFREDLSVLHFAHRLPPLGSPRPKDRGK